MGKGRLKIGNVQNGRGHQIICHGNRQWEKAMGHKRNGGAAKQQGDDISWRVYLAAATVEE